MMDLSESDQITTDHINCCEKCYFSNITHEINGGCSTVALPVAVGGVVASEPATSDTSVLGVTTTLHPLVLGLVWECPPQPRFGLHWHFFG